jgi:tetratricopeptide (TPR) repeat protein
MALDIRGLWDYRKPALSEQRFRDALAGATDDEALILQTQIARSWGLRKDFVRAREILASVSEAAKNGSAEARVNYLLELGRTYASPAHPEASLTAEARQQAHSLYLQAFETARHAQLDVLAIDALHMMPLADPAPGAQLEWNLKALAYLESSSQPAAKAWEASLRNNVGYARFLLGEYDEALAQYRQSLAAHERAGRAASVRIAHWMIARALRAQGKIPEAIDIQLRLEREWDQAGEPDPYVFEELEHLYRAQGDAARADGYAARLAASKK